MGKTALIFPGQGAQRAGMGRDFYESSEAAKSVYDRAGELLGMDMKSLCFEPNELLDQTEYTQAALVTTCLAMLEAIKERKNIRFDAAAGLSLGEYCALAAAGAMSIEDAVCVVRRRGILMQEAVPAGIGAMSAVIGMTAEEVRAVLRDLKGVEIANYNCPGQIVISGYREAVEAAAAPLKEAGARRVLPLKVSGPFHSWLLEEAGSELYKVLEPVELKALSVPYLTNVDANYVKETDGIKESLVKQISSPVLWQQSVETMAENGVDTFIEIGPGKTLTSFVKKICKDAVTVNIEKWEDMEKLA
ncbi:ACP S-malonyltransferase [Lachnotalea sp. AF33-28]|uniref:ACP S-malonyltransferase n=1 Tax=Lachnotalea sp. AF33-28 TaxID=2292046 RepID=UPI000E553B0D|nr:ACP S-malonyltransferase [Lachnotalea sp. AF33-28]RHP30782.1 [acyl-carrier-protein] S-malonyltransferase [Lachnotalea sp. AF33-28]